MGANKRTKAARELVEAGKSYSLKEAVDLLKKTPTVKE